jgi:hypothetical protein
MDQNVRFPLVVLLALLLGCSRSEPKAGYSASEARKTLVTALGAWKQAKAGQLAKSQPPIRFVDDDWHGGWQLMDFQVGDAAALFGPFQDVPVTLTLRNRSGRTIGKQVKYQVTLEPALAVLRSD